MVKIFDSHAISPSDKDYYVNQQIEIKVEIKWIDFFSTAGDFKILHINL